MPFDFVSLLGGVEGGPELPRLCEYFEERPQTSTFETCHYLQFCCSGFSLMLDEPDRITCIHIHTLSDDGYQTCADSVPFDFSAQTKQAEARELLGPPTAEGGPVRSILSPKNCTYWDRWEYAQHSLHLTYNEQCDSVVLITLMSNSILPESAETS